MGIMIKKLFCVFILLPVGLVSSFSQNVFSSEEDLKKQANKLFEEEEFAKAYPLFSQLLSLYPKDPQYNYKFGTCLLYSTSNKGKAIPYIEYGAKRQTQGVDKEVFFYLARAYHLNYRFADAVRLYNKYKSMASARQLQKYDVERQIEMCENGKKLLKTVTDLVVLEKKEIAIADFFRSYNLTEFNAKLIVKPDELKSSIDKKKKDESVMYLAPDRNVIYYSSYGEDGKTGKDIYYVTRTGDGLSKPIRLSDVINTKYDEDYAFFHPDGRTLYFCSKGHNSMGGYDIFKSEWNVSTQSWGKPVNMDFPINTPDDDILFITDSEDKTAYFSSKRESADGTTMVYKIRLERKPLDLAIISGTLKKEVSDKIPKAVITITKLLNDEVVGVFNTNAADGSYTLKLPNGGKFMFAVQSPGFKKSSELVVVPNQQEIVPLKQEIILTNDNGTDKLIIKNSFDAEIDSADITLATEYIKAKASLEVSPPEQLIATVVEEGPSLSSDVKAESKPSPKLNLSLSNDDIISIAYEDARQTQKEANELRKNSDAAQQLAHRKNELSLAKNKEANDLMRAAESIANQEEKLAQIDNAIRLRKEADELSKDAALSLTIANQLDAQAKAKQKQADAELKYAKDLDNAIKSGANEKRMNELLAIKEALDKKSDELNATQSISTELNKQAEEKQAEASKAVAKYLDIQQDVEDLRAEAKRLRTEAGKTKNEGVKQNLITQAEEMEKEAESKSKEAAEYNARSKKLQAEADSLKNNATLASAVMKQIENETIANAPVATNAVQSETKTITANTVNENKSETLATSTAPKPIKITSPYVDVFVKQMYDAEKIPNELEKQETLAVLYQSWTDSLDKQIASLKVMLASASSETDKNYIQNKIYELESSAEDKRQRAVDSRNKVDNLKLQQALADASNIAPDITPVTTNTVTETTINTVTETSTTSSDISVGAPIVSPDNMQGIDNINTYYESKLKEITNETNPYVRKTKEQEIYNEWASALYDESVRLRKEGKNNKANNAESASKEKQALAMKASDEIMDIKTEHPEWVDAVKIQTGSTTVSTETPTATTYSPPEPPTIPTNNTSLVNSTSSETAAALNSETATSSSEPGNTTMQPALSTTLPENVKNKDEYARFVALRNEADWAKKNSERYYKQVEETQKIADEQQKESERLIKQSENETNLAKKQMLISQSEVMQKRALRNQAKADSLRVLAINSEQEANSKRIESDLYLQSLDKEAYEEITAITSYKPAFEPVTNQSNQSAETALNNATNTTGVSVSTPETTLVNTNTISSTQSQITETVSSTSKAETTETISANKIETESNATIITSSSTQPQTTETASWATETETTDNASSATTNKTVIVTTPSETITEITAAPLSSPTTLMKYYDALFDRIEITSSSSYSSGKPIPVNPPMPEGLVFKVQIGAFRNPIPQNLFKGIKPIAAETTPQGFKRYTAGLFRKFSAAAAAKKQVNDLGYRDAFVVAFYNGKRIPIAEAITKAKETGETVDIAAASTENVTTSSASSSQLSEFGTLLTNVTDVRTIQGLFYTVQIGVFSKEVTASQLYNISPINAEKTDKGLIRYTTGRFDDEAKAIRSKNNIVSKGISDAFVVAYYNGKRISLTAARAMINTQGNAVLAKDKQEYSFIPTDTVTSESSASALNTLMNKGVVFKVQVGAYKERVPIEDANKLLKISNKGIKTFKDETGMMIYAVGEFLEYEAANNFKSQMIAEGFSGAFVIAFKDGIKMSAAAALELLKNR